jgi:hypothetical protein
MSYFKITKINVPLYLVSGGDELIISHYQSPATIVLPTTPQEGRQIYIHATNQLTVQHLTHQQTLAPGSTLELVYLNSQWHTASKHTPQKSWLTQLKNLWHR